MHDPSYDKDMKFTKQCCQLSVRKKGLLSENCQKMFHCINSWITFLNAYKVGNTGAMEYLLGPGFRLIFEMILIHKTKWICALSKSENKHINLEITFGILKLTVTVIIMGFLY